MTTDAEEIANLRTQIAGNTARLTVLEARNAPKRSPQPPPPDEGVRITEIAPTVNCELPNETQLRELATIVLREFPKLAPSHRHGAPSWERDDIERRYSLKPPDENQGKVRFVLEVILCDVSGRALISHSLPSARFATGEADLSRAKERKPQAEARCCIKERNKLREALRVNSCSVTLGINVVNIADRSHSRLSSALNCSSAIFAATFADPRLDDLMRRRKKGECEMFLARLATGAVTASVIAGSALAADLAPHPT